MGSVLGNSTLMGVDSAGMTIPFVLSLSYFQHMMAGVSPALLDYEVILWLEIMPEDSKTES